jgi:hypothetical protein
VRINPHGMYARAIEETDYIVPRGGYFFEVKAVTATAAAAFTFSTDVIRSEALWKQAYAACA